MKRKDNTISTYIRVNLENIKLCVFDTVGAEQGLPISPWGRRGRMGYPDRNGLRARENSPVSVWNAWTRKPPVMCVIASSAKNQ